MIYRYICKRCEHEWPSKLEMPRVCPKCKSPYWDKSKNDGKPMDLSQDFKALWRERVKRNKWGRWKYNPRTHELEINKKYGGTSHSYGVDLERCTTSAELLDWIYQVKHKGFIRPDDIADLVYAIDDIFDTVQRRLCSCGDNLIFNPGKYLIESIDPLFNTNRQTRK